MLLPSFRLALFFIALLGVSAFAADPKDKDPAKSAWVAVARVLLNLDEFITRE